MTVAGESYSGVIRFLPSRWYEVLSLCTDLVRFFKPR